MTGRDALKTVGRLLAGIVVTPMVCSLWVRGAVLGRDRALEGSTQLLALVPGLIGQYLRRAFLSRALSACAPSATIEYGTIFSSRDARIEEEVYIGPFCLIGDVHFCRGALVGPSVQIPSGRLTHGIADTDTPVRDQPGERQVVRIGADSWIGGAAVVMADVGNGTIVGAGAVVTRPLPDGVVAGGVPARVIRSRQTASVTSS